MIPWAKQVTAAERSFARALRGFFSEQANRIASKLSENFPAAITPDATAAIFNAEAEHQKLMPLVQRNLGRLMIVGAVDEYEAVGERLSPSKSKLPSDIAEELDGDSEGLPPRTRDRIRLALDELSEQAYWRNIQTNVEADLAGILREGIDENLSHWAISKLIREELGGFEARKRAMRIARTEVAGSMNAGHVAAMEDLADAGLLAGKEWLAISDRDTRPDHLAVSGSVVAVRGNFSLGGFDCPYPGWWGLPAHQRVHCRCTTIGVVL